MEEGAADIVVVAPARVYLPSFGIYTQMYMQISTDRLNESKLHHT